MNCSVTFSPFYCLFQDQALGMMIGNGKARDGLYYMAEDVPSLTTNKVVLKVTALANANVLLWYKCLGHPSFPYLS